MKLLIALRDSALDSYANPMTYDTAAQAVRDLADQVNGKQSHIAHHPDDYEIFIVGKYDPESAQLFPMETPERLARAKDLIRPQGE